MWDLNAGACSCELVPDVGVAIRSICISGDGTLVVAANSNGVCYVWKLRRGAKTTAHFEPLRKLQAHDPGSYVLKCLISPDGRLLATASSDKTVKLWNLQDGFTLERTLKGHTRWVWDCVFSVDAGTYFPITTFRLPDRPDYPDCLLILWSSVYPFQSLIHITKD